MGGLAGPRRLTLYRGPTPLVSQQEPPLAVIQGAATRVCWDNYLNVVTASIRGISKSATPLFPALRSDWVSPDGGVNRCGLYFSVAQAPADSAARRESNPGLLGSAYALPLSYAHHSNTGRRRWYWSVSAGHDSYGPQQAYAGDQPAPPVFVTSAAPLMPHTSTSRTGPRSRCYRILPAHGRTDRDSHSVKVPPTRIGRHPWVKLPPARRPPYVPNIPG